MSRLKYLTEKLSKYLDRPIVDYWRKVQGVNVGFRGNPGEGVPIAGPPVLTGGAGTSNPLLKPLLSKYKPGTYIGDAIRKENFPLSAINFIEQIVGGTEDEIRAKFAEVAKEIEEQPDGQAVLNKMVTDALGTPGDEKFDKFVKVFSEAFRKGLAGASTDPANRLHEIAVRGGIYSDLIDDKYLTDPLSFDSSSDDDMREIAEGFYQRILTGEASGMFSKFSASPIDQAYGRVHAFDKFMTLNYDREKLDFNDLKLIASTLPGTSSESKKAAKRNQVLDWLGGKHGSVMDRLRGHFYDPSGTISVMYAYLQSIGVAGTIGPNDIARAHNIGAYDMSESDVKSFFSDLYVANQLLMPEDDYIQVTRGMGTNLPGMSPKESGVFMEEVKSLGVPVRVSGQRAVSGFAEGGSSDFKGYSIVGLNVPKEAVLSAFSGLRPQSSTGFVKERETLVIGAAEIAVPPENISNVPYKAQWGSE